MELKDWCELAKALVTIGTLIFTAIQALLLRKQMKKEHEKRRRENTVDVMYNWCNSLEKNTSLAVDVAQQLSSPQCQSLYNKNSFEVTYDSTNFQVKSICSLVARIACWYNVFSCNVTTCFVDMNFQLDCIVTAAGRTLAWPRLAREFEPMVFL